MNFSIDPYVSLPISENVEIKGSLFDIKNVYGVVDRGLSAALITKNIDPNVVLTKTYDVLFLDYAKNVMDSTALSEFDICSFKNNGSDVIFQLPILTANIRRFYAPLLFDSLTGLPKTETVYSSFSDVDFLVRFWTQQWADIIKSFARKLKKLEPNGILLRGLDLYKNLLTIRDSSRKDVVAFCDYVFDLLKGQNVYVETEEFLDEPLIIKKSKGVFVNDLFLNSNGSRIDIRSRLSKESKLNSWVNKEVFVKNSVHSIGERKENAFRLRRKMYTPVNCTLNEDGYLDNNFVEHHKIAAVCSQNGQWKSYVNNLDIGTNRVLFFTQKEKLGESFLRFKLTEWQNVLKLPSRCLIFTDRHCSTSFINETNCRDVNDCSTTFPDKQLCHGDDHEDPYAVSFYDKMLIQVSESSESILLSRLYSTGLRALFDGPHQLCVLISDFNRHFTNEWLHSLNKILDRFTYPVTLRKSDRGIVAYAHEKKCEILPYDGTYYNLVFVRMYHEDSHVFLVFCDNFALQTFDHIMYNISSYSNVLNDESVFIVSVKEDMPNDFVVVPIIERMQ